ncbi:DUF4230 domain-containing protein [Lyngbya aestuarii]|uniref:DUF4230 domain-containing protein n=1 Tax=Lyngbya aestuarii TaxID=118322 RepID=UPI00403DD2EA
MRDQFQRPQITNITSWLLRNMMLLTTSGAVLATLFFSIGVWRSGARFFDGINQIFNAPPAKPQVDVRSVVVNQVRGVSELTTSVFSMEAVVPTSQERRLGGYSVGRTTLLYIAYGEVRAGVDLGELKPENVRVLGDTVELRLPAPRMLDSKIDVTRSQVYDYDRGFLSFGPDVAPQLQILAQQETLKKITAAACREGLLEKANDRAQIVITQLLNTTGYKQVNVTTQAPPPGTCASPGTQEQSLGVGQPGI